MSLYLLSLIGYTIKWPVMFQNVPQLWIIDFVAELEMKHDVSVSNQNLIFSSLGTTHILAGFFKRRRAFMQAKEQKGASSCKGKEVTSSTRCKYHCTAKHRLRGLCIMYTTILLFFVIWGDVVLFLAHPLETSLQHVLGLWVNTFSYVIWPAVHMICL